MNEEKQESPQISIIIPCYNEEEVITMTCQRLQEVLATVTWQAELIFVNDGSRDNTLNILKDLYGRKDKVQIISFTRNFGHQIAVSAGLQAANGDAAIIIDADLQDPPELMDKMVSMWQAGEGKIIYGKRTLRRKESLFKKMTARTFYRILNKLSDVKMPVDTGDFRLIDRQVITGFNALPERNKYIRGLFPWMGYKAVPLEYERDARLAGVTKYPLRKMMKLAMDGLISFSHKPLQLSIGLGLVNLLISFFLILYVLISYILPGIQTAPGWASTLLVIIFFSGVQLIILGIIGIYIGRIFDETKNRPEFIIDEHIRNE